MKYFGQSDIGIERKNNEDNYAIVKNKDKDLLVVVCDGVGGGNAGEVASFETVNYFTNEFKKSSKLDDYNTIIEYLNKHIDKINDIVYSLSTTTKEYKDMATTLTGFIKTKNHMISFNVGDSRVLIQNSNSKITSITTDHNYYNDLIRFNNVDVKTAKEHKYAKRITRAIGSVIPHTPEFNNIPLDVKNILVCTDGFYEFVSNIKIQEVISQIDTPIISKVDELIKLAIENESNDNITIVLVDMVN